MDTSSYGHATDADRDRDTDVDGDGDGGLSCELDGAGIVVRVGWGREAEAGLRRWQVPSDGGGRRRLGGRRRGRRFVVALLTELCEALSFCMEDARSYLPTESAARALMRLAAGGGDTVTIAGPDEMLLAVRAITYLCDAMPRVAGSVVRHVSFLAAV